MTGFEAAITGLQTDMVGMIATAGGAGLAVAGVYLLWRNGIGIFKKLVKP